MTTSQQDRDRFVELKVERALFGLSDSDSAEFFALSQQFPNEDMDDLERVAAAVDQTLRESHHETMPDDLRRRIREQSRQFFEASAGRANQAGRMSAPPSRSKLSTGFGGVVRRLPWLVTAASLLLAFGLWNTGQRTSTASLRASRSALISSSPDLVRIDWSPGPTPIQGVHGDVVWSSRRQQGYMRFENLPINDPTKEQYQLWIFDRNQDEATPIDGGVFDIDADGEVIVPIQAKLRAKDVYLFAVTIEKPGGVVVSSRERLPLLASAD